MKSVKTAILGKMLLSPRHRAYLGLFGVIILLQFGAIILGQKQLIIALTEAQS